MFNTADDIKLTGNLVEVDSALVEPKLASAERYLKAVLPVQTLDDINNKVEPYGDEDFANLKEAEAFIALSLLIPVLNTVASASGGIARSVGLGEGETTFISHAEAQRLSVNYKADGDAILMRYLPEIEQTPDRVHAQGVSLWRI